MASFVDRVESLGLAFLWSRRPNVLAWTTRIKARPADVAAMPLARERLPAPPPAVIATLRERLPILRGEA